MVSQWLFATPTGQMVRVEIEGALPEYANRTQAGWTEILAHMAQRH
jgi:hypothetical protein